MPPESIVCRNDSEFARLSRSPYQQVKEVRLREDSQGNIEGVEYLAGLSGYDTEDECDPPSRKHSISAPVSRSFKHRYSNGGSRRTSHASARRSSADCKWPYPSGKESATCAIRLCPSPGKRPSAQFMLSSPEMSGKDEATDDDVPKLSLAEGYIPQPKPSIGKSPLLNRDLLRFANGGASVGSVAELEPMIFALSRSEHDSDWTSAQNGVVDPKLAETPQSELPKDQASDTEGKRSAIGEGAFALTAPDETKYEQSHHQAREDAKQD